MVIAPALPLDRIACTQRPAGPNAGTQRWRELLFLHWSIPVEAVRPLIPAELELDAWEGRMWIGAVPFRMQAVRPWWLPRPAALDFLELNLRTYVHHRGAPGVWFFSLEASSWLAVRAARAAWSLPYWHARMRTERDDDRIVYESSRRATAAALDVEYTIGAHLGPSKQGTLEHFLFERYLVFAHRRGRVLRGTVNHPPYDVHLAHVSRLSQTLSAAAGLPALDEAPALAHYSPGLDVEVFGPTGVLAP